MNTADRAIVFDVDGTLMDTNYQHAVSWFRALRARGVTVPLWQIHRAIGMGGDRLVAHVAGDAVEGEHGDWLRDRWKQEYERFVGEVVPLPGAADLLATAKRQGFAVVLASSGDPDHVERYLDVLGARDVAEKWTTAADAESSKPAPDLLQTALSGVEAGSAVLIGDSTWDCHAARNAGLPSVGVLTGGFSAGELRDAGAAAVFDELPKLASSLAELPFG